jgi:hypothetical protein
MRLKILFAMATIGLLTFGAGTALAGKANTRIKDVEVLPNADFSEASYSGRITSPDKDCLKGRKVKIIHLSDPPFTIGETTTDEDGNWELDGPLPPGPSEKIKIKVSGSKHCNGTKLVDEVGQFVPPDARPALALGAKAATTATITKGGPTLFKGKVASRNDKCVPGRKVQLMYTPGKHSGAEATEVGSDRTNKNGVFAMPGNYYAGFYYVVVLAAHTQSLLCTGYTGVAHHF